ncbi:hypothetical protein HPP92_002377 [Vanilla planifolia]|uniref:Uncharacterized protein n=1 Tax=Vanilla planifolia TaxID=51239 RepID=A0A835S064_VANPL|nr:hypothetical protein HPP92_002377 [Vanilla planifolia]
MRSSLFLPLLLLLCSKLLGSPAAKKPTAALFIFGDTTVSVGNNNYIVTLKGSRANRPPYGQNGSFGQPTGRFSDGRIIVDFIEEYAKLPPVPPYLQASSQYIHGVNFASGGAGVLPETHQGLVIGLQTQLKQFDKVKSSLSSELGDSEANELISNAVYCINIGTNDYLSYLGNPKTQEAFAPEEYVGLVIGNISEAIQELYEKGARKFGILSLPPLGCLPSLRAANPKADGTCLEEASSLALAHNSAVSAVLISFQYLLEGFKYAYSSGFYAWLYDLVHDPTRFGFKDGTTACCGSGPYRGEYSCGGKTDEGDEYEVCETIEDFVWWDSFHGTEKMAKKIADSLWDGSPPWMEPYNLKSLFFDQEKTRVEDLADEEEEEDAAAAAMEAFPGFNPKLKKA